MANGKFHSLYHSARLIKHSRLRLAGHIARIEECSSAFKIITVKTYRKGTSRKIYE